MVVFLDEIETALSALWQEDMVGAVEERDSRYVTMIGRSESYDNLLGTRRCSNILEGGIYCLRATERVADLQSKWGHRYILQIKGVVRTKKKLASFE